MGGRSAEELVFHEPTTGASSDIDQATKIARAMVTEYGMSARLGAVRYGREQGDPFLGRSMGNQPDYSLEVAHEIDEEVRALIEAAHTEAWEILNTYRDVLDDLVFELLQKETLTRIDLERIFDRVEKRPRITAFNDFGQRTPSDKPPIKTPAEQARERGESWPPEAGPVREPTPVGSYPGGGYGVTPPGPNGAPPPTPPGSYPGGPQGPGFPATNHVGPGGYTGSHPGGPHPGGAHRADNPRAGLPNSGPGPHPPNSVPHNYGAPPDWRPATTPSGQTWPPPGQREPATPKTERPWAPGNGRPPVADEPNTPPSGVRPPTDGGTR
jgi:cell division protease FtsH